MTLGLGLLQPKHICSGLPFKRCWTPAENAGIRVWLSRVSKNWDEVFSSHTKQRESIHAWMDVLSLSLSASHVPAQPCLPFQSPTPFHPDVCACVCVFSMTHSHTHTRTQQGKRMYASKRRKKHFSTFSWEKFLFFKINLFVEFLNHWNQTELCTFICGLLKRIKGGIMTVQ